MSGSTAVVDLVNNVERVSRKGIFKDFKAY